LPLPDPTLTKQNEKGEGDCFKLQTSGFTIVQVHFKWERLGFKRGIKVKHT